MLDRIIQFSIQNKLIIGVLTFALICWGIWSATKLPIDAVPDITNNQVQIITQSPALAAQEVERLITFPIELGVASIPEIQEVRSISRFGLSVITIVFNENTDIYWARQQVGERLKVAAAEIPIGVGVPELGPVSSGLGEIYQYVICPAKGYEEKYTDMELRSIQDWVIRRQLLGTKGVADVSSFGGHLKQYEVSINPDKLRSMNTTLAEVFNALEANNQNTGGAYIDKNPQAWFIRTEGLTSSLEDIGKIVIKNTAAGMPVLIRDVATVQFGSAIRYGAMTHRDEGEAVGGVVLMLKGENSNAVIRNVKEKIEQIKKTLPKGVVLEAYLDRTTLVNKAIHTVSKNLIEGALIVVFVLVLLLGNIRAGLIVATMIPLCMLFAIAMMNLFDVSGNLMSLGAVDFGLIVDGAVIIVEATLHHIVGKKYTHRLSQKEMDTEVYNAASKIRNSAAFGEIIILIVYLPILALVGIEGKMFRPMAQTVSFAIIGAFILSLTYVPMMSALFLSKQMAHKKNISDKIMNFFQSVYSKVIHKVLDRKMLTLIITGVLFIGSIFLFIRMGGEFIPTLDEGDFAVETRVLIGSSMSKTIDVSVKAGAVLLQEFPEVINVVGKIGTSEIPTDPMPMEACDLIIILKEKGEWTSANSREELANKMQEALEAKIPGVTFGFQQPIQMRFNELMTGARQDVALKIYGEDLDELTRYAKEIGGLIEPVEGVKDLYIEEVTGLPQIIVTYNMEQMARYSLSVEQVNTAIRSAFAGEKAGMIYEGEKRYDLVVRLDSTSRKQIEDVRNLYVASYQGIQIPLRQVADIEFKNGPNQIQRDDTKRRIIVAFNTRGRDVESIVNEIQNKISERIKFKTGYHVTYGGQFKNLQEAKSRLSVAVPVALVLIFILLYFTFSSIKQSLLIYTAIPLSAIGGIIALSIRDMPFSISAGVGFIALFGVAVLNGIVLIGEFNRLKKEGMTDVYQIVLEGTSVRLRPVLMTALVASLGFLPMALSHGSGAEVQKPLATVVIGGLISATLLTLLVLPILYIIAEKGLVKTHINKLSTLLILGLIFTCFHYNAYAQDVVKEVSLEEAITLAKQNNAVIKVAEHTLEYHNKMKGTATEFGKTSATLMYGQYNSFYNDNNITVSQTIPFPTVMHKQARYYGEAIKSAELNKHASENELVYQVRQVYYLIEYAKSLRTLYIKQDSVYTAFYTAAELRYKTGESNMLEKATAESQLYEVRLLKNQNENDILILQSKLKTLLNSAEEVTTTHAYQEDVTLLLSDDSIAVANNPALAYMKQQVAVNAAAMQVEKNKLMPDITVGYFNQSLRGTVNYNDGSITDGATRFQGISAGIAIPIWAKPQADRIKATQAMTNIAKANSELYEKNLQRQYTQAYQEYLKYQTSVEFYRSNALPTAKIISDNAWKNYRSGNIGYLELSQGLNRALSMQLNYLHTLSLYNQSIITIEYLIGNN
ncbi:CusA/CzcA family heavy metal efflux RND transporter [Cytophaga hutchinsonii]|uniref:Possible copper transport protein n=1 Tax=Cytophaga hutchinsonii (strain ATCC 33406 / DSM 1761 / CIP 103989 / NBRC 15051 / NCIMB 9469 / D465) TaxID=269798 RepID=A0A6N4SMG0_CYTH3|nr:CusA/CzcA family heavy metal efflux RND transporter [Cytophaga hutchinsonii]ABG57453.1 possible copper transport protein [Cytophaga hutchinsonii ATCC 33406]SFW97961.1 cobalt-zinc-cadmium resistance protein CzcA [Cytophaga hutchinsonii ATCC 33406]